MQNAFRAGFYRTSEKFRGIKPWPYREDNKPKKEKQVVFQKDYSGNDVDLTFKINAIPFNSKLNAQLLREFAAEKWTEPVQQRYASAIMKEYVMNQRQFAFYLVDCVALRCNEEFRKAVSGIAQKNSDKFAVRFFE